ncbi:protein GRIM REAPER-like [Aristolochia californica]|uniref:protein GRIM REAPER-like n=1 Tax=Aristolochia californica TaxID=171875 RepID=UPI0035E2E4EB
MVLALVMAHVTASTTEDKKEENEDEHEEVEETMAEEEYTSLRGVTSFLLPEHKITCQTDPTICYVKGSPGPSCCRKLCVDTKTDPRNCGECKLKCKSKDICCRGQCIAAYIGCINSPAVAFLA